MGALSAITSGFAKSFQYSGRSVRSEFIWFFVFVLFGLIAADVIQSMIWGWTLKNGANSRILTNFFLAVVALPLLALSVRRLQDTGLHVLVLFIPALLFYANWYIFLPLSQEYAALVQGPNTPLGHVDNIFNDISRFTYIIREYGIYIISLILIAVPTDGAARLRAQLPQPKERQP
ncbi:MAG: DUF805 domain-containing protein [Rhodobacteraceae bacterium]|nr:DUF805 domain-containing protein [Paracoccaceae bacterium]